MDIFKLKVFPPADVFPMLPDDELCELADDIKTNGLREPIVIAKIDGKDMLVDGRNRREACKIAKVKPSIKELNGTDPIAFILSANVHRRHLTKSQRAMAVAMIYPKSPDRGGRGKKGHTKYEGFSPNILTKARFILANAPDLTKLIIDGGKTISEAHSEAVIRKTSAESDDTKLSRLRELSPDIAELVTEGRITLAAGLAEFDERKRRDAETREHGKRSAAVLENEISGHVANVMAAIKLGEKNLIDKRKLTQLEKHIETLKGSL